jgi:hypothetical protein
LFDQDEQQDLFAAQRNLLAAMCPMIKTAEVV